MPAIQNEYDDYSYIAMRRGTAKAAPRVADSKKRVSTSNRTAKKATSKTTAKPRATTVSTSRMVAAKNANKESIRTVMRENSKVVTKTNANKKASTKSTTKRKATHNLDVPNIKKKSASAKPQELSLKKADMMKSPKQKANQKTLKKENVVKNTATFLCMFSILLLICYKSSVINESFQELGNLKDELEDTYALNAQIEAYIQEETNPDWIAERAKNQLGMQKPKESQIQRIYVEKEDKITTPIVIEEEKTSFLDNLINDFLNLID